MRPIFVLAASLGVAAGALALAQESKPAAPTDDRKAAAAPAAGVSAESARSPLDFTMKDIDGRDVALSKYRGKVVLLVNVASECGLTPQYEQLQALHEKHAAGGLAIVGVPANNFRGQEPGSNDEIKAFCQSKYHVAFDLLAKVSVKGDDCCELYKFLSSSEKSKAHGGEIKWNFTKFLIDRDGKVIGRFEPRTRPDDASVTAAIEKALAAKATE